MKKTNLKLTKDQKFVFDEIGKGIVLGCEAMTIIFFCIGNMVIFSFLSAIHWNVHNMLSFMLLIIAGMNIAFFCCSLFEWMQKLNKKKVRAR